MFHLRVHRVGLVMIRGMTPQGSLWSILAPHHTGFACATGRTGIRPCASDAGKPWQDAVRRPPRLRQLPQNPLARPIGRIAPEDADRGRPWP